MIDDELPTIEELDEMREERGIKLGTLSICASNSISSFGNAVRRGNMSDNFKRNVLDVLDYYDDHGIIPEPPETGNRKLNSGRHRG